MFVEVIVDIKNYNLDKIFYYKVPEQYYEKNLTGYRVEVPFASRIIQGYIIGYSKDINFDKSKCKYIKSIKDDFPVLTTELINLSKTLSDELYCKQIQVIEAILPTIFKNKYVEYYKIIKYLEIPDKYKNHFSKENFVKKSKLDKLVSKDEIEYLISNKIIKLVSINKEQLKKEQDVFLILTKEQDDYNITNKQKILVNYLKENKKIKKSEVKDKLNIGESVVKKLLDKNILTFIYEEKEIELVKNINRNINTLNSNQQTVFEKINSELGEKYSEFLLYGVTGSGKTEVYINLIKEAVLKNKEVIVLVPEIILTPQIEKKFRNIFGDNLAVIHSGLSKKEKYIEWKKIKDKKVNICLGTRSAIFAPFENIGLIIIDEEHESTYKQEETPRYNAKNIAQKRAINNNAILLYASATPSIDLYYKFKNFNNNNLLILNKRFNNKLPKIDVVNITNKEDIIVESLLSDIKETILRNQQVLLFINKRGYTNFIKCFNCDHIFKCKNCDISLNYHKNKNIVKCHFCGYTSKVRNMKKCCNKPQLVSGTYGIQKVEEFLKENIQDVKIIRMDSDNITNKNSYKKLLKEFKENGNILLGTQMISKGLDFPNITLVGIFSIENIVSFPSFKSNEKLFQLLVQTAGRAGRSDKEGKVFLQTNLTNKIINLAIDYNYEGFYNYELNRRRLINYPPFCNISFLSIKGINEEKVKLAAISIFNFLIKYYDKEKILGPNKSLLYKINNEYKYNIIIKYKDNEYNKLHKILKYIYKYFQEEYEKSKISIIIDNNAQDYI